MAFLSHEPKQLEILISSDPAAGGIVSQNGSRVDIRFDEPLRVPVNAVNVELQVAGTSVWYTQPNIITGINDELKVEVDGVTITKTLPQGQYNLESLILEIEVLLDTFPEFISPNLVEQTLSFSADVARERVVIKINTATNFRIVFGPNGFGSLLGFVDGTYGPPFVPMRPAPVSYAVEGLNTQSLQTIEYYLVHSDIAPRGIRVNSGFQQVVAQVPLDAGSGQQTVYAPINPPKCRAQNLAGLSIDRMAVWITNEDNGPISSPEPFSVRMIITYSLPLNLK
jgi:hypothetical protein